MDRNMQPLAFSEPGTLQMSDKLQWAASSPVKVGTELPPGAQRYTSHTRHSAKKKYEKKLLGDVSLFPSAPASLWNFSTPGPSVRIPATLRVKPC